MYQQRFLDAFAKELPNATINFRRFSSSIRQFVCPHGITTDLSEHWSWRFLLWFINTSQSRPIRDTVCGPIYIYEYFDDQRTIAILFFTKGTNVKWR